MSLASYRSISKYDEFLILLNSIYYYFPIIFFTVQKWENKFPTNFLRTMPSRMKYRDAIWSFLKLMPIVFHSAWHSPLVQKNCFAIAKDYNKYYIMFNIQTSSYSKIDWWDAKYIKISTFMLFIFWLSNFYCNFRNGPNRRRGCSYGVTTLWGS